MRKLGSKKNPYKCFDLSEACDTAVELGKPVFCTAGVEGMLVKCFPSRVYEEFTDPLWCCENGYAEPGVQCAHCERGTPSELAATLNETCNLLEAQS